MTEELEVGMVVAGRFRLDRPIGRGGMGEVWAATHTLTGKAVALKFLKASRADDPRGHARMLLEARASCSVRHPNIAEIHDVLELESGLPFLVMDLLEGETLAQRLAREGKLAPASAAAILRPIADALAAAHAAGVIHRDIKPANIFLAIDADRSVRPLVLDFGIAKLVSMDRPAAGLTTTGELMGTSLYMAPEQVYAETDLDGRVDVWSLGVVLYEALSGARPTERESVGQVLSAITREPIPPLEASAGVPAELAQLVARMLSRDREQRASLDEVRDVLRVAMLEGAVAAGPPAGERVRPLQRVLVPAAIVLAIAAVVATITVGPTSQGSTPPPARSAIAEPMANAPIHAEPIALETSPRTDAGVIVAAAPPAPLPLHAKTPPRLPPLEAGSPAASASGIILTYDRK